MGSNHLNQIFGNKSQLDEFNEYLIKVSYMKITLKRKISLIQNYIAKLKP